MKPTLMIKGKLVGITPEITRELEGTVPLEHIIGWFRARENLIGIENKVLILRSDTASGKSTALPPEIYKAFSKKNIICTQPRVITAIENVNEMLKHYSRDFRLGETIGWSTKYNKLKPKSIGLLSATIGTLMQMLKVMTDDEIIESFAFILIDEVHERDLQTEMTITMLKNFILRNCSKPACPFVVLMSATFDPASFLTYFGLRAASNFIWCSGATAEIIEMWDWNNGRVVNDFMRGAATIVAEIIKTTDDPARADIIIFMPGSAEFKETLYWLNALNEKNAKEGLISQIFAPLSINGIAVQTANEDFKRTINVPINDQTVKIGDTFYKPTRRVIIATNVAETGLTLDNLKYVIDSGFNREIEFNSELGIRALVTKPAPRSRVRQRRGRVGRKFPGIFYPLYPKFIFDKLQEIQFPQILTEDLSAIMLDIIAEQLKSRDYFTVADIDMLTVPGPDAINHGLEKLYCLGFISQVGAGSGSAIKLTALGDLARRLSFSPEISRMIFSAYYWQISILDIVTLAAYSMIDKKSFGIRDKEGLPVPINWPLIYKLALPKIVDSNHYNKIRLLICDDFIDGIILLSAAKRSLESAGGTIEALNAFCERCAISSVALCALMKNREELIEQLLINKMNIFSMRTNSIDAATEENFIEIITKIKYCIYEAYRLNILTLNSAEKYLTTKGIEVKIPQLIGKIKEKPTYLIYKDLALKYNMKAETYEIRTDFISMLDGFISPDFDFSN